VVDNRKHNEFAQFLKGRSRRVGFSFFSGDGASLTPGSATQQNPRIAPRPRVTSEATRPVVGVGHAKVAILGAGNGGLALAGILARQGHRVSLWNRSQARIAPVQALRGVKLTMPASTPEVISLAKATTDMASALADVHFILVAVPASGHADVARRCAPYLRDGQTVLLLPGRTGGAMEFQRILRQAGCRANILLGEANTFPVAARCVGGAEAVIFGTKSEVEVAALPASRTGDLLADCRMLLPMLVPARSVLHTGFANVGAILHPIITLLNARRIADGESFDFYTEGVTPRAASLLEAADAERLSVARAYGVTVHSLPEWIGAAYGHHAGSMLEAVAGNPAYLGIKAPATIQHRYLLEDVPTGLIPLLELGRAAGLALPILSSLVNLAEITLGGRIWQQPRTLKALGLAGLTIGEIRAFVDEGEDYRESRRAYAAPLANDVALAGNLLVA
jgi:opine dehydrogenase